MTTTTTFTTTPTATASLNVPSACAATTNRSATSSLPPLRPMTATPSRSSLVYERVVEQLTTCVRNDCMSVNCLHLAGAVHLTELVDRLSTHFEALSIWPASQSLGHEINQVETANPIEEPSTLASSPNSTTTSSVARASRKTAHV